MISPLPHGPPPQPVTQEQLNWITESIQRAAATSARRSRNRSLIGFLILILGLGFAIHGNSSAIEQIHTSSTKSRDVICQLILSGDQQTYKYGHEGTLTPAQVQRSLKQSAHARKILGPAKHCITTITPEAK